MVQTQSFNMEHLQATPRLRGSGMTSQRARERLVEQLRRQGIRAETVLEIMRHMPRHIFIDEAMSTHAYDNNALPIGYGQTISQPYIVARMTELLTEGQYLPKVLEIGTGCGYQTAVLAQLCGQVYTLERIEALHRQAQTRLKELGANNVHFYYADGFDGLPRVAPFDGIVVTASPDQIPLALIEQLRPHARMVIPVGEQNGTQTLQVITRTRSGYDSRKVDPVVFVPLKPGLA